MNVSFINCLSAIVSFGLSRSPLTSSDLFLDYLLDCGVKIYLQDINGALWLLRKWAMRCSGTNAMWRPFESNSTNESSVVQCEELSAY